MTPLGRIIVLVVAAGLLGGAACSSGPEPAPPAEEGGDGSGRSGRGNAAAGPIELGLRSVVSGLDNPILVTNAGDGSGRLFVVEQTGRILIVEKGELRDEPFLDVSDRIVAGGEQGLLGLAFHPRYETNGRFFIDYTDVNGDTVVAEYSSEPDANVADGRSERGLLHIDQPYPNHNGGNVSFGPDGYLYIGMGDGGSGGDPLDNGQSLSALLGKMLRIDVDGAHADRAYSIPPDNPLVGRSGALPEVWAMGLRNPWRFSFDGDELWIGDVGQSEREEIDRVALQHDGIYNFGWRLMEGDQCYEPANCDPSNLTRPITSYSHDAGCSITGGYVYRGEDFPELQGTYLFGDYCSGSIWGLDAAKEGRQQPSELLASGRSISSFGIDEAGELYLTDHGGELLRVTSG